MLGNTRGQRANTAVTAEVNGPATFTKFPFPWPVRSTTSRSGDVPSTGRSSSSPSLPTRRPRRRNPRFSRSSSCSSCSMRASRVRRAASSTRRASATRPFTSFADRAYFVPPSTRRAADPVTFLPVRLNPPRTFRPTSTCRPSPYRRIGPRDQRSSVPGDHPCRSALSHATAIRPEASLHCAPPRRVPGSRAGRDSSVRVVGPSAYRSLATSP